VVARAVVTRLGLDKDPAFAHPQLSWRIYSALRSSLGLREPTPSNHDFAVEQLMRRITVTNDTRSYLISISVNASVSERAAWLANAVAFEYMRGQLLQQQSATYAAAERDVAELSAVYGVDHPAYINGRTKLEQLQRDLIALRNGASDETMAARVTGQFLVPAQEVTTPSGPNIPLVLGLSAIGALGAGIWAALRQRRVSSRLAAPRVET
jgi:uncharacterized protein involved in exopolysaccharide biosynthesis